MPCWPKHDKRMAGTVVKPLQVWITPATSRPACQASNYCVPDGELTASIWLSCWQHLVSQKKKRLIRDGFDLDLSYVRKHRR